MKDVLIDTKDMLAFTFVNPYGKPYVGIQWKNGEHSMSNYRGFRIGGKASKRIAKTFKELAKRIKKL